MNTHTAFSFIMSFIHALLATAPVRADPWRWLSALTGAALAVPVGACSWLAVRDPPRFAVLFAPLVSVRSSSE